MTDTSPEAATARPAGLETESLAYLLVGGSGTGKSTFFRRLASARSTRPLFLVGGNKNDYPGLDCRPSELSQDLLEVKNCMVVLDDLFSIRREKDSEILRHLLCKTKRHNAVTVGVAVHTLEFTGLRGGVFDHFDVVVFTKPKQEEDRNVALFLKRLGQADWIGPDAFAAIPEFGYLWVHVKRQEVRVLGRDGLRVDSSGESLPFSASAAAEAMSKRRELLKREMGKILRVFPDVHVLASCHLDYILKNLSPDLVSTSDFTLTLRRAHAGRGAAAVRVSLLDFLVTCQTPGVKPTKDQKRLKKYLDSKFLTPRALIRNAGLR